MAGGALKLDGRVAHIQVRGPVVYAAVGYFGTAAIPDKLVVIDASHPMHPYVKGMVSPGLDLFGLALVPDGILCLQGRDLVAYKRDCLDPGDPIVSRVEELPRASAHFLAAPVPNPFNPSTRLDFTVTVSCGVELVVYDVAGRRVRTLVAGELGPGGHSVTRDGRDDCGRGMLSGVYLVRLRANGREEACKLTLVKWSAAGGDPRTTCPASVGPL